MVTVALWVERAEASKLPAVRSRVARIGAAAVCVVTAAAVSATPGLAAGGTPKIGAKPGFSRGFDRNVTDYVSRCRKGQPLELSIDAPNGVAIGVDGAKPKSGRFKALVPLSTGQRTDLVVRSNGSKRRYHVRCLPRDFPRWSFERFGRSQAQWHLIAPVPDVTAGNSHYVTLIDSHGVPVWWKRQKVIPLNSTLLPNGDLAWGRWYVAPFGMNNAGGWEVHHLDGRLVRTLRTAGSPTDVHDMEPFPNGNYLLLTYKLRKDVDLSAFDGSSHGNVVDGEIQELTPAGKVVWSWNSKDHIALSENTRWHFANQELPDGTKAYDYFHINSVEPDGDGLVISARHVDAVYRIDRATGDVQWKLGGSKRPKSLTVIGDHLDPPFIGQHDARLAPDGTLTVFDNHTYFAPPRGVRFRIDTTARTATVLDQVTDPKAPLSPAEGSARRLPGGNWVVSWGATHVVSELTPSSKAVWRLTLDKGQNFRVTPIPFGRLAPSALRGAMDKMHPRG
jgi:arylsulfotransferase ASST